MIFEETTCNIRYKGQSVAVGDICGNLYKLKNNNKALSVAQVHDKNCQHQWHRRLGHKDPKIIKDMINGEIKGVHIKDCGIREVCKTCLKGKMMTRNSFPKSSQHRSEEILDIVHTDVCDPMQMITSGKKRYINHD